MVVDSERDEPVSAQQDEQQSLSTRQRAGARDMIFSLLVLLVIVGVVVMLTRGCQFSPGGPSVDSGAAPTVDAGRQLRELAERVDFPVRDPRLPESWRANSAHTEPIGAGADATVVSEVGWLTSRGRYLQVLQSPAKAELLVDKVTGGQGGEGAQPRGSVPVGEHSWRVYPGREDEKSWVGTFGEVRVLLTGSARTEEFRTAARAVQQASPLPG